MQQGEFEMMYFAGKFGLATGYQQPPKTNYCIFQPTVNCLFK